MKIDWLPARMKHEIIFGLDAFRGIAALLVVLFHFWTIFLHEHQIHLLGLNITAPFSAGHVGVDIFFVLSGFLVFLSLVRSRSLMSYTRKRFWRIVPLSTFFVITIFPIQYVLGNANWMDFWTHISFTQAFFHDTYHSLHPVMWTLSVEVLFYVALPIILFVGRKKLWHFWSILLVLAVANFGYREWITGFFDQWDQMKRVFFSEQLWGRFDQFILGIGVGTLWIFRERIGAFVSKISLALMLLGLAGFVTTTIIFAELGGGFRDVMALQLFLHFGVGASFAVFLVGFLFSPRRAQQFFAPASMTWFGIISYSVYLWHFPVQIFTKKIITEPLAGFVVSFVVTVLLSMISFWMIERPFFTKKSLRASK